MNKITNLIKVQHKPLRKLSNSILKSIGCSDSEASIVTNHLVDNNLKGHDSHGIGCLPYYVMAAQGKKLLPNAELKLIKDAPSVLVVDGAKGFGQRMAKEATELAIRKTKGNDGITMLSFRGSFHVGRIGDYAEICAEAGLGSVFFVNVSGHAPLVAPFNGSDARFGTNPFCVGLPAGARTEQVILDMATSKVALGKVREASAKGEQFEEEVLMDDKGVNSKDPTKMFTDYGQEMKGALLPFGLHKGSGLAIMCELMAGSLTGGGTMQPENNRDLGIKNCFTAFIFDPKAMDVDIDWMKQEQDKMLEYIKKSPATDGTEVLYPGEPERIKMKIRSESGFEIGKGTWDMMLAAAQSVNIEINEKELTI